MGHWLPLSTPRCPRVAGHGPGPRREDLPVDRECQWVGPSLGSWNGVFEDLCEFPGEESVSEGPVALRLSSRAKAAEAGRLSSGPAKGTRSPAKKLDWADRERRRDRSGDLFALVRQAVPYRRTLLLESRRSCRQFLLGNHRHLSGSSAASGSNTGTRQPRRCWSCFPERRVVADHLTAHRGRSGNSDRGGPHHGDLSSTSSPRGFDRRATVGS